MPDPPLAPGYLAAVLDLVAKATSGPLTDVFVFHDDSCPILSGRGACACTPTITRGFVLWHRKHRRAKWEMVGLAPTERAAWAHMGTGGRKGGAYVALPAGREPSEPIPKPK